MSSDDLKCPRCGKRATFGYGEYWYCKNRKCRLSVMKTEDLK